MVDVNPTVDWNPLGEVFYRKSELYTMHWTVDQVDLAGFMVAAAPYGGPIALVRDEKKIIRVKGSATKPVIFIYSASGNLITNFKWDGGRIMQMGWSKTEDLVLVLEDGMIRIIDINGEYKTSLSLGEEVKASRVLEARIFQCQSGTGVIALSSSYRFFVISDIDQGRMKRLADIPDIDYPPSSWVVIPDSRSIRVLVAIGSQLHLVDAAQTQLQYPEVKQLPDAYVEMAVSFDYKYLAMFGSNGVLWVGLSNLQEVYCECNTQAIQRPRQLAWCGSGAIVAYWENLLFMVGPNKDWVNFHVLGEVCLVPEPDGLRIVSNDIHEFLQRVPDVVEDVFKIGSVQPGAVLFDSLKEFEKKSAKADEYLRVIRDNGTLSNAVDQCIQAAGAELEPKVQRALLKAASFGKCFIDDYNPMSFFNMCHKLRVLNAVKDYQIGMPITLQQMEKMTLRVLIDRLVLRRHFCLAIRICDYMRVPDTEGASRILAHWACYKVQQSNVNDEQLAQQIAQKLGDTRGISYTEIASRAIDSGRKELAIRLLDYEPRAAEQVPLLIQMNEMTRALEKAISSGDTDLVHTMVMHLKDSLTREKFLMTIQQLPVALNLYMQSCREEDKAELKDVYEMLDRKSEKASVCVEMACSAKTLPDKLEILDEAKRLYGTGRHMFEAKATEDQMKLLQHQKMLEEKLGSKFIGLPLSDTMFELMMRNSPFVEKLRNEFKVPDKRYWWLKVRALAQARNWLELERFSRSKKSPIGYEPFVDACYKNGSRTEAVKYIIKVNPENQVKCYVQVGSLELAAERASQQRSDELLDYVLTRCGPSRRSLVEKINSMKAQLAQTRR